MHETVFVTTLGRDTMQARVILQFPDSSPLFSFQAREIEAKEALPMVILWEEVCPLGWKSIDLKMAHGGEGEHSEMGAIFGIVTMLLQPLSI